MAAAATAKQVKVKQTKPEAVEHERCSKEEAVSRATEAC
jgi:hypothetical protein